MDLKKASKQISESVVVLKQELEQQKLRTIKSIEEVTEELKSPTAQTDKRENAAFSDAISKLSLENATLKVLNRNIEVIKKLKEVNYKSIQMVVLYSTVLLRLDCSGKETREFYYKLFPEGVSDLEKHILAKDSPVGQAIWLKEVGESVTLTHKVTGELLHYTIVDVY